MLRLLICGDRYYTNKNIIRKIIISLNPSVIIEGGANGADAIACGIANELGIKCITFKAKWKKFGNAAGPIRNREMIKYGKPDIIYAFHDNIQKSKGTKDMIGLAKLNNIPCRLIRIN